MQSSSWKTIFTVYKVMSIAFVWETLSWTCMHICFKNHTICVPISFIIVLVSSGVSYNLISKYAIWFLTSKVCSNPVLSYWIYKHLNFFFFCYVMGGHKFYFWHNQVILILSTYVQVLTTKCPKLFHNISSLISVLNNLWYYCINALIPFLR